MTPLIRVEGKSFGDGPTLTVDLFLQEAPLKRSSKSQTARDAEAAFGLGECLYFYAGHACPDFGDIVLAYEPDPPTQVAGGATPFDTGGVFIGKVFASTLEGLSGTEEQEARCQYVERAKYALSAWRSEFDVYVETHFTSKCVYVRGGTPRSDDATGRLCHPKNSRRAWTWEVRFHADHPLFGNLRAVWVSGEFYERLRQEVVKIGDAAVRAQWLARLSTTIRKGEFGVDLCTAAEEEVAKWQ